jgi:hypothetical protein
VCRSSIVLARYLMARGYSFAAPPQSQVRESPVQGCRGIGMPHSRAVAFRDPLSRTELFIDCTTARASPTPDGP